MRLVHIDVSTEHGHGGCQWSVKHDGCRTWTWTGVPDVDLWLAGVGPCCQGTALARMDSTFQDDLRVQFDRIISSVRSRVTCNLCWPDTQSKRQMAAAAAVNRNSPSAYGTELAPELRKAAPPYAAARKRFMETGTIADRKAMLAFVTMTEPDLEALGRDWEPKRGRPAVRRPAALSLSAGGLALVTANLFVLGNHMVLAYLGLAMIAASWVLAPVRLGRR